MTDDTDRDSPIGWFRAILTVAVVAFIGIAVLVYGTNAVLTKWHGRTRSSLVGLASTMFFVVLLALAWALRQLQRRKMI
jgi:hypothetical protein